MRVRLLRVVGADDSDTAQREKLAARDIALAALAKANVLGLLRARAILKKALPDARVTLRLFAPDGRVKAPTVQIALGAGAGRNWWGLLCPEACAGDWQTRGARFSWPVLEFLWSLFW